MLNSAGAFVLIRHKSSRSRTSIRLPSLAARRLRQQKSPWSAHRERVVMAKTVADQFAETLAAAGVKRIYGIVGGSLNGPTGAIFRPAWAAFASGWGGLGNA